MNTLIRSTVALALAACTSFAHAEDSELPDTVYVQMSTNLGDVVFELDNVNAPISTANFLQYTEDGFYDGTIFHRVMPTFMIQGGGFTPDLDKKNTRDGIQNEWKNGLEHTKGSLAMARFGGQPDSGSSQFFINVKNNGFLQNPQPDGAGYAVFGKVVAGIEVVDAIKGMPTGEENRMRDVPTVDIIIEKMSRLDEAETQSAIEAVNASTDSIQSRVDALLAEIHKAQDEARKEQAAASAGALDAGKSFLAESEGVDVEQGQTSANGGWHIDTVVGEGEMVPNKSARIQWHYTLWLTDGTRLQSSHDGGNPATFALNGVIKGWTEGLATMREGGTRYLILPPNLAYGKAGRSGIPPNSTLVFKVELISLP